MYSKSEKNKQKFSMTFTEQILHQKYSWVNLSGRREISVITVNRLQADRESEKDTNIKKKKQEKTEKRDTE